MKTKLIILFTVFALTGTNLYAENALFDKLDGLKDTLHKYFIGAPRLNFEQKLAVYGIFKLHRSSLRANLQALRKVAIEMRRAFRKQLTHEQLLKVMEMQDEFVMRGPAVKAALFLKKLEAPDRAQLLDLLRRMRRGKAEDISKNLDQISMFFREKVRPIFLKELAITEDQQVEMEKFAEVGRQQTKAIMERLIKKMYRIRSLVHALLTEEQHAFIETHRDKIFQHVLDFVMSL